MKKFILASVAAVTLMASAASPAFSFPLQSGTGLTAPVIPVAEGCGWGRWRGPWGGCRDTPYTGPLPGGGYAPAPGVVVPGPWAGNGCPPGYWHGPWGHCRDTPYHGRLPGGGWQ